jgi:hypothetical protein
MGTPGSPEALLLTPSVKGQLPNLTFLAAFLIFEVIMALTGELATWMAIAFPSAFVAALALGTVTLLRSRGKPWQLRCTTDGVEARGFAPVAWSALAEVRISRAQPRWLGFLASSRNRLVTFVPHEVGTVPSTVIFDPSSPGKTSSPRAARWRTKHYGSPFTVLTQTVDATPAQIAAAIRRLTDVPVID